ncbi:C-X-C motif chemokine 6-like isoform X2 [Trematomus bernacchii]|uniref:C-X-C motif chemokine 6-like isoform X2 n=1 Tax=Trematomus bernacchii TaxID=40690 RepID=UPI00146EB343|nr:C-X-C motif chemokine 6-like isoform X2 [Trematomus bernacchii]
MSSIMKVFLLLAVIVCITEARRHQSGGCLCQRVRSKIRSKVKDIQIRPATTICDKVEIVVTDRSGLRFCLDPELAAVQRLMASIIKARTTARPAALTSSPDSTNTLSVRDHGEI